MTTGALAGKRALVVGAGSGIGRAVCDAFVAEGAQIGVLERDAAKCERLTTERPECIVVEGDATSFEANTEAVDAVVGEFGGLDVLVNCVGIFDFYRGVGELSADQLVQSFDELYRVNVLSHVLGVKAALPALNEGAGGSVVLTASTSSFYPGRGGVHYVGSKFAVRGLVITLAHELAPSIRVNGVAPGGTIGTQLSGPASLGLDDQHLGEAPDREAELKARVPLRVALDGHDHAHSFVFLASDGSRGITGTFLHPDGGMSVKT